MPGARETGSSSDDSAPARKQMKWSRRRLVLAAALLGVIVIALVVTAQVLDSDPSAANWINGLAAVLSGMNVVLTFFILNTALGQLEVLHEDMSHQQMRHRKEIEEQEERRIEEAERAHAELERQEQRRVDDEMRALVQIQNAQELLEVQAASVQISQESAREAQQEAAKTRLDLNSPRCSIELNRAVVSIYRSGVQNPQVVESDVRLTEEDLGRHHVEVALNFDIKNWGKEPVTYSLGSPWENTGSYILYPMASDKLCWVYRTSAEHWMQIFQGQATIGNINSGDEAPSLITLWVPVSNLANTVNDMHRWDSHIMPVAVNRLSVTVLTGHHIFAVCRRLTVFERDYIPLRNVE